MSATPKQWPGGVRAIPQLKRSYPQWDKCNFLFSALAAPHLRKSPLPDPSSVPTVPALPPIPEGSILSQHAHRVGPYLPSGQPLGQACT